MIAEAVMVGLAIASLAWAVRKGQNLKDDLQRNMAWAAERLRGQGVESVQSNGVLVWDEDGPCEMRVKVEYDRNSQHYSTTVVTLPCAEHFTIKDHRYDAIFGLMEGQDVVLGDAAFDQRWRVQGPEVTTRLVWGVKARRALTMASPRTANADGKRLLLYWKDKGGVPEGDLLWRRLRRSRELRQALGGGAWEEVAAALEMRLEQHRMSGTISGLPVAVIADEQGTRIEVTTTSRVLAIHKDWKTPRLWVVEPTGNPVADNLLKVGGERDAVQALLNSEGLELLLQVVHGWPGSTVHAEGVTLVAPTLLVDDLADAMEAAVRLAQRL